MKKVVVVGSVNIDHILKVDRFPLNGETVLSEKYELREGGKGANQAVAISRLGVPVNFIGKVGDDLIARMLIRKLKKEKIDIKGITTENREKTGLAFIMVDQSGNNTIVVNPGANGRLSIDDIDMNKEILLGCDVVVLQMEIPGNVVENVISFAYRAKKLLILNLSPFNKIKEEILKKVDFLIVNEVEAEQLTGAPFNRANTAGLTKKIRKFFGNNIVITLGKEGAAGINEKNDPVILPAYPVNKIDSTGAGDAFMGGFVYGLVNGRDMRECISLGNAAGSISITKIGAQSSLPYIQDLNNFLELYKDS